MNLQQAAHPRSSANGFNRRRVEKDNSRMDMKSQPGKSNFNRVTNIGLMGGIRSGGSESPSQDRLVYLATCLIGHHVEVQVKNGSVYTGIFHATNADKDFGVVLKMARLTKDVSLRVQKAASDSVIKAPSKTLIIPAHELVQVVAKDVPVTMDELSSNLQSESNQDIMLDSYISHSRHVDAGRELEPWMPDKDDPICPGLENVFDSPWTGSWDQFKVNEKLFGVKSTFDEELYTTKLERGPRTQALEEQAMKIAREIEGEETHDLHLAEERGVNPYNFDIDEETKYSSVYRGVDDSGCGDEDVLSNSRDAETFGDSTGPAFGRSFADVTSGRIGKGLEGGRTVSRSSLKDIIHSTQFSVSQELCRSGSLSSDLSVNVTDRFEDDNRVEENHIDDQCENTFVQEPSSEEVLPNKINGEPDLQSSWVGKRSDSEKAGVSLAKVSTSDSNSQVEEKTNFCELSEDNSGKGHVVSEPTNLRGRPGSSGSCASEAGVPTTASSGPALSPSSSVGSLSSEKSTLNPNAKEFRLDPNAKSFVPSQSPLRPPSPVNDASFYYPTTMPAVPHHMHGMPVGIGVGPSFVAPQPMLFNPQAAAIQSPQAYYPANGPQMIVGHPRQLMYMQGYPSEMQYKGRE